MKKLPYFFLSIAIDYKQIHDYDSEARNKIKERKYNIFRIEDFDFYMFRNLKNFALVRYAGKF